VRSNKVSSVFISSQKWKFSRISFVLEKVLFLFVWWRNNSPIRLSSKVQATLKTLEAWQHVHPSTNSWAMCFPFCQKQSVYCLHLWHMAADNDIILLCVATTHFVLAIFNSLILWTCPSGGLHYVMLLWSEQKKTKSCIWLFIYHKVWRVHIHNGSFFPMENYTKSGNLYLSQ